MKEIKYRAFIESLKWITDVELIDFVNKYVAVDLSNGQGDLEEYGFDEVKLSEWTGLKDKNGTEIYEGHKVENKKGQWTGEIVFEDGAFRVARNANGVRKCWVLEAQRAEKVEIVGSIYDSN